jgi:sulfatase modifying factor 1
MGSVTGSEAEKPVHLVALDEFYLDACVVSNTDFARFIDETGYVTTAETALKLPTWRSFNTLDRRDHPVVMVSWHDANAYAAWCNKSLPTEAQWEKAARAGGTGDVYPWGHSQPESELTNWMQAGRKSEPPPTAPATLSKPNAYGLHHMTGNVWQWCADWYGEDYYSLSSQHNPRGPETGQFRVRRGGAWNVREPFRLRCANRGAMSPDSFWPNLGFRCAWPVSSD